MKELLRGESTISLEAAVLKCPNAELYFTFTSVRKKYIWQGSDRKETSRSTALLQKLTVPHLVKKFLAFYKTRRFSPPLIPITSQINPLHALTFIVILPFHLRPDLLSGLFPLRFPNQNLVCISLHPHSATCHADLNLLDFITQILVGEDYVSESSCNS
jgi:hypothetical protein